MPRMPRIFTSSKFQASFFLTLLAAVPLWFTLTDKNLDRDHKQQACIAFIISISAVWGVSIHGTATEDAAKASAMTPVASPVQVNTADAQTITPTPQTPTSPVDMQMIQDIWQEINQMKGGKPPPAMRPLVVAPRTNSGIQVTGNPNL